MNAVLRASSPPPALRLLTYNVWGLPGWVGRRSPGRMAAIADRLRRMHIDIAGLQEMWSPETLVIAENAGFDHSAHTHSMRGLFGANGLVTLSRHPIVEHASCTFSRTAGLERFVGKGALFTRIGLPDGRFADVFNTHLLSPGAGVFRHFPGTRTTAVIQRTQLEELRRFVAHHHAEGNPCVVLGDFNVDEQDPLYRTMTGYFGIDASCPDAGSRQRWEDRGGDLTIDPRRNHWARVQGYEPARIDYVFLADSEVDRLEISARRAFTEPTADGRPLSDHFGVVAELHSVAARAATREIISPAARIGGLNPCGPQGL